MGQMFTKVRSFLDVNKVFFEVFSWIVLGVMGVIVSVATLQVSRRQADFLHAQVSPTFDIEDHQGYDAEKKLYTDDVVTVSNSGFPLSEFSSNIISLYEVTRKTSGGKSTAYFPVVYLGDRTVTQNPSGRLITFRQTGNSLDITRIEEEMRSANGQPGPIQLSARLINLLTVLYQDALHEKHSRYFRVEPMTGGEEVDESEARKWTSRYHNAEGLLLQIREISRSVFAEEFDQACALNNTCSESVGDLR